MRGLTPKAREIMAGKKPPYWLKGYANAAYLLDDQQMIAEAKVWIEGAIAQPKARRLVRTGRRADWRSHRLEGPRRSVA